MVQKPTQIKMAFLPVLVCVGQHSKECCLTRESLGWLGRLFLLVVKKTPTNPLNKFLTTKKMENPTQQKSWFARHKILTGIICFFLFVIIAGSLGSDNPTENDKASTSDNKPIANPTEKTEPENEKSEEVEKSENERIDYIKVTADELCNDYEKNEINADKKYKNQLLEISGVVDGIDSDIMDEPVVRLKCGNEYSFTNVSCSFTSKDEAAELEKGKEITIIGKSTGEVIGSPTVKDCQIKK